MTVLTTEKYLEQIMEAYAKIPKPEISAIVVVPKIDGDIYKLRSVTTGEWELYIDLPRWYLIEPRLRVKTEYGAIGSTYGVRVIFSPGCFPEPPPEEPGKTD